VKRYGLIILLFISVFYYSIDNAFALQNQDSLRISLDTIIHDNTHLFPFHTENTISGLALSGEITLHSNTSLVRIVLMDKNYDEYLIFETYPMLAGSRQFSVDRAGEETFLLKNISPYRVTFELINASIYLKEIIISEEDKYKAESRNDWLLQQSLHKIERINQNIHDLGQKWMAGETSISKLSYQEKKRFFGGSVPNFQGFEYYAGGVFVLPGAKDDLDSKDLQSAYLSQQESQYASEFSWKNRHGEDWVTPVKNQGGCNACWAFGTTAAAELLVNLYYNRHLDYDLSEQNIISCTEGSCNDGGEPQQALDYASHTGIVMEDCFPYTASDQDCFEICSNPPERIKIDQWTIDYLYSVDDQKSKIIDGATAVRIIPWKHFMQAVGYKVLEEGDNLFLADAKDEVSDIDSTYWITLEHNNPLISQTAWQCKNSWGEDWGNHGYVYLTGNWRVINMYSLYGPVSSLEYNEADILCTDNDGDGYYYWGTGPKPSHCPDSPDQQDGDDSDPCIGPMDEFGISTHFTPTPDVKDTIILYGQTVPDLFAVGSDIQWYSDKKLLNLVHTGNRFTTGHREIGDYTHYVTQTLSGCESAANAVTLSIWLEIPRPSGHDTVGYAGKPSLLTVTGKQWAVYKWYEDPLLTTLLHTGESYETEKTDTGTYTYYVTQTLCQLESAPDTVVLSISYLVDIPDPAFLRALIAEGVDTYGDRLISCTEAEAVSSLDVSGKNISNMTGIEAFVNLDKLNCSYNQLTSLDVSCSRKLRYLNCSKNKICSLDISHNTSLERLFLQNNCSLLKVCVWTMPFPPNEFEERNYGTNVYFTSECAPGWNKYNTEKFNIYPNPTSDLLTIETKSRGHNSIEITLMNGQLLYSDEIEGPTVHQIDLTSFQKGIYFVIIRSRDYVRTEKIIKQ
jgi:hypothetical protein